MEYAYELKFNQVPDYAKLRFLIGKSLCDWDHIPDTKYSWVFDDRDHSDAELEVESGNENLSEQEEEIKVTEFPLEKLKHLSNLKLKAV